MLDPLKHNKKKLQKFIDKYDRDTVHGVYITEFVPQPAYSSEEAGNVRKFFRKGYQFKDGYGTTTSYMIKFSGIRFKIR